MLKGEKAIVTVLCMNATMMIRIGQLNFIKLFTKFNLEVYYAI